MQCFLLFLVSQFSYILDRQGEDVKLEDFLIFGD